MKSLVAQASFVVRHSYVADRVNTKLLWLPNEGCVICVEKTTGPEPLAEGVQCLRKLRSSAHVIGESLGSSGRENVAVRKTSVAISCVWSWW
jgi:hypothetical protein